MQRQSLKFKMAPCYKDAAWKYSEVKKGGLWLQCLTPPPLTPGPDFRLPMAQPSGPYLPSAWEMSVEPPASELRGLSQPHQPCHSLGQAQTWKTWVLDSCHDCHGGCDVFGEAGPAVTPGVTLAVTGLGEAVWACLRAGTLGGWGENPGGGGGWHWGIVDVLCAGPVGRESALLAALFLHTVSAAHI